MYMVSNVCAKCMLFAAMCMMNVNVPVSDFFNFNVLTEFDIFSKCPACFTF